MLRRQKDEYETGRPATGSSTDYIFLHGSWNWAMENWIWKRKTVLFYITLHKFLHSVSLSIWLVIRSLTRRFLCVPTLMHDISYIIHYRMFTILIFLFRLSCVMNMIGESNSKSNNWFNRGHFLCFCVLIMYHVKDLYVMHVTSQTFTCPHGPSEVARSKTATMNLSHQQNVLPPLVAL